MQRFQENFTVSPQSPSWDRVRRVPTWPTHDEIVAEQQKDELSRSRSPTSVTLNDMESAGLESVLDQDKEVVPDIEIESSSPTVNKRRTRRPCFILALVVATFIVIAVAVGVGVALGRQDSR